MKIDHSTFIVERFPVYQALLRRDRRNHRIARLTRWAMYAAAFALGAWIAATTGGAA